MNFDVVVAFSDAMRVGGGQTGRFWVRGPDADDDPKWVL